MSWYEGETEAAEIPRQLAGFVRCEALSENGGYQKQVMLEKITENYLCD